VQSIEFQTPYEQIVLRSRNGGATYSRSQAGEAYRANPSLVIVKAVFALRFNYSGPVPPADSFKVRVFQTQSIAPRKRTNTLVCDPSNPLNPPISVNRDCSTYMRDMDLQFDAGQFALGRVTVRATPPMGSAQETKFNLDELK
jgi:hypothetical protein